MHLNSSILRRIWCVLLLSSCGDDAAAPQDADVLENFQLEILTPPGDSIGLDYSGSTTLRIRYLDENAQPIANATISFELLNSAQESTGGASLSANSATTNSLGIAEAELVVGAERVNFRVSADAHRASSSLFYVQVSDQGFTTLNVTSTHEGPRDTAQYGNIQLRIYNDRNCSNIDMDAPPASLLPTRTQTEFGTMSEFRNLPADEAYSLLAWTAMNQGDRPAAVGCLDLAAEKLRSGSGFSVTIPVVDRAYEFTAPLDLQIQIDLRPATSALPFEHLWSTLSCPLGHAQLLLDCLADAQATDGILDCQSTNESPLSTALALRRGPVDTSGCRPAMVNGQQSIDSALYNTLQNASSWPSSTELMSLLAGRQSALSQLILQSQLLPVAPSPSLTNNFPQLAATHRLLRSVLGGVSTDLVASDRSIIEVHGLPIPRSAAPTLALAPHSFTLRYGEMATETFEVNGLSPANASQQHATLGQVLLSGVHIEGNDNATGCQALTSYVCTDLALPQDCANQCTAIAPVLNGHLDAWRVALQTTGADMIFSMTAEIPTDSGLQILRLDAADEAVQLQLLLAEPITLPTVVQGGLKAPPP